MSAPLATTAVPGPDLAALSRRLDNYRTHVAADFPHTTFRLLREEGLLGLPLDPPYRPSAHSAPALRSAAFERLLHLLSAVGRGSLPAGRIYEGHVNALHLIELYGTSEQRTRWYADARDRHLLFGVWNTEMRDGVKIHDLGEGRYRLEGAKTFCSGSHHVERPIVPGALLRNGEVIGWQMCIVPSDQFGTPGRITSDFWQPLGMQASASYRIDFSGIELTEVDLLGPPDAYHQQPAFSGGAVRFAAVHLGGAEALFDQTLHFLRQQGRCEHAYQAHRLGELAIAIESGRLWLHGVARHADYAGNSPEKVIAYANMTRTAITELCQRVLQTCARCVGARGFLAPHPIERIYRDLTMYLQQPNPDGALADLGKYVGENRRPAYALWEEKGEVEDA